MSSEGDFVWVRRRWAEWVATHKRIPYRLRRVVYSRRLRPLIWRTEIMDRPVPAGFTCEDLHPDKEHG